jgi:hypothetical protein
MNGTTGIDPVSLAYIHGRIDSQIDGYAASIGVPATALAARLAALLSPAREGSFDNLPLLPSGPAEDRGAVESMEMVVAAHGGTAPHSGGSSTSQTGQGEVAKKHFSPEGLKAISEATKRRWAKAKKAGINPNTGKKLKVKKTAKKVAVAAKKRTPSVLRNIEKQRVYQLRHKARKKGLALPPLPGEKANATVQ